ncbi:MAG TPA: hypothetical protein VFA45_01495 [Actinomycetes bacterium]|nr:hypothetical protein [Actinomycetes bacterium]
MSFLSHRPVLLTQRRLAGRLPPSAARVLALDDPAFAGEPDGDPVPAVAPTRPTRPRPTRPT